MNAIKEMVQFFQEVKLEFSKVVWPKTNEFVGSVLVVLFLVLVFAIYLGVVDWACAAVMKYIFRAYGL